MPQGVFSLSAGKERDQNPRFSPTRITHEFIYQAHPLSTGLLCIYVRG